LLRSYKTAADWLNASATELMDRRDQTLIDAACVAAYAERDYLEFKHEQDKQKAKVRG